MNFRHIPFTSDYHGFIATVAIMFAIAVVMLVFFRIKRWI
jgi:Mg2+ and Co2+ transporter CorA